MPDSADAEVGHGEARCGRGGLSNRLHTSALAFVTLKLVTHYSSFRYLGMETRTIRQTQRISLLSLDTEDVIGLHILQYPSLLALKTLPLHFHPPNS